MKILLLVRNIGPAEGTIFNRLKEEDHEVEVYDVNGEWLRPHKSTPIWMKGYRLRRSILAANQFNHGIANDNFDRIIAIGLEASGFAANILNQPFIPLLLRGSLDFSTRRSNLVRDFEAVLKSVDRLLLDDEWEMDKAGAKGSQLPHLRAPSLHAFNDKSLLSQATKTKIALIHPLNSDEARVDAYLEAAQSAISDAEVFKLSVESLYSTRDLRQNRSVAPTVKLRLEGATHVMFVGSTAHHAPVLSLLRPDWSRVVVEETIGAWYFTNDLNFAETGRGLNLVTKLRQTVHQQQPDSEISNTDRSTESFLESLDECMGRKVPELYEELSAFSQPGPLNVFLSVASLEDRTNGARPQRIRNLAQSLAEFGPTVRVFAGPNTAHRRLTLLRRYLAQQGEVGILYGENSTTPITSDAVVEDISKFIDEFREAGGKSGFFIRDLYWLEDKDDYVTDATELQNMRTRGANELEQIGDHCDVLFSPVEATGRLYNQLLENAGQASRSWHALPPAVAPANVCNTVSLLGSDLVAGTTLLYAGGQGAVYGMDQYLTAISSLPSEGYWFDFIARQGEVDHLLKSLARFGLDEDPRVRISTVALDTYLPRTSRCIGINLLDSDYAKAGFQYKTVSMLERGFAMLCFEDMAIANFVVSNRVGIACERSVDSIIEGLTEIEGSIASEDIEAAQKSQTWHRRIQDIREALNA
ncbi:MAG: hypothetical protein ACTHXA_10900 [Gulosibacter sp.]|uniref:hypothetical protein n=1 Tax=Gulosibacter sp. TaxID=2817531 RepID=UPI003F8DE220